MGNDLQQHEMDTFYYLGFISLSTLCRLANFYILTVNIKHIFLNADCDKGENLQI